MRAYPVCSVNIAAPGDDTACSLMTGRLLWATCRRIGIWRWGAPLAQRVGGAILGRAFGASDAHHALFEQHHAGRMVRYDARDVGHDAVEEVVQAEGAVDAAAVSRSASASWPLTASLILGTFALANVDQRHAAGGRLVAVRRRLAWIRTHSGSRPSSPSASSQTWGSPVARRCDEGDSRRRDRPWR